MPWSAPVVTPAVPRTVPKKITGGHPHGEWSLTWQCPSCRTIQDDSVDPDAGPWGSCICGSCQAWFYDGQLDPVSQANWDDARNAAEAEADD